MIDTILQDAVVTDPGALAKLQALRDSIPDGEIRAFEPGLPDAAAWNALVRPHLGQTWSQVPWLFAEFYFYRRVLEALGYHAGDLPSLEREQTRDPYRLQKRANLDDAVQAWDRADERIGVQALFHAALWGNRADLSLFAQGSIPEGAGDLLADDSAAVVQHLEQHGPHRRLDLIADNAGAELAADLHLVGSLLEACPDAVVHVHVKPAPTFVSDAVAADVDATLARFPKLAEVLTPDRLRIETHPFWGRPEGFDALPHELVSAFSNSGLVVIKGDANYRRLVGDRPWLPTTPVEDLARGMPRPFVAVRTLKSEVTAGLSAEAVAHAREHADWMTSGAFGVIQFVRS